MCIALLQLDFGAAWRSNPGVMLVMPCIVYLVVYDIIQYVRFGTKVPESKKQKLFVWSLVLCLLIYMILRNLPAFSFLTPS